MTTGIPMVLGTMHFGTRTDERTSFELLDHFVAAGGTMLDTADCYSFWASESGFGGQSEAVIGRWLAANPGVRDQLAISTKVGAEPTVAGGWPEHRQGLSAASVTTGIAGSLDRLGVDHVDVYWAHMEDRSARLEETVDALGRLAKDGMVGRLGVSNHPMWIVERARGLAAASGLPAYSMLQLSYSYLQPRPFADVGQAHRFGFITDDVLDYVDSNPGVDLWAYTTLLGGSYGRADRPLGEAYEHIGNELRLAALDAVAGELGVDRNRVVLAWLTGGSPRVTPIVGVSSVEQLDDAIAGVTLTLSDDQRARLDAAA